MSDSHVGRRYENSFRGFCRHYRAPLQDLSCSLLTDCPVAPYCSRCTTTMKVAGWKRQIVRNHSVPAWAAVDYKGPGECARSRIRGENVNLGHRADDMCWPHILSFRAPTHRACGLTPPPPALAPLTKSLAQFGATLEPMYSG